MNGEPIEFDLNTSNATAAVPLVLRSHGDGAERVLAANERMIIYNLGIYANSSVGTAVIFADHDGDGLVGTYEALLRFVGTAQNEQFASVLGWAGAIGQIPLVVSLGAGLLTITGQGVIVKG